MSASHHDLTCTVCGGREFRDQVILWKALVEAWGLDPEEEAYVNRQQGTHCVACGANLRSIALANAIRAWAGTSLTLQQWVESPKARLIGVLEVNEAGALSGVLSKLPGHVLARYPEVDMMAMPFADGRFNLVVHSDTLEHVPDPGRGLRECRRVLARRGALCFTVPTIVGRMTRRRDGLPPSYHSSKDTTSTDMAVQTEFGADAWTHVIAAGFASVAIHTVEFPSATALLATVAG